MTPKELAEKAFEAFAMASGFGILPDDEEGEEFQEDYMNGFYAAIAVVLEEAAKVAVGPVLHANPQTGEPSLHGTKDGGNWSVPQPLSGYKGSEYGTGRYDAAAAIRALKEPPQ